MENVIECKNLTHYYGKRLIYENLSFSVPKGRILGLLGKNGTGKTTTINILSGFLKPRSGNCYIFGEDIVGMRPELRKNIGLLIEGHVQYRFMNIEQIEKFYAQYYPQQWEKEAFYDMMQLLKVAPRQMISRMSCGQRSQVALGLIMAQNPELLVLDDFSLGLDPGYRRLFVDYLRDYARTKCKTVFLTSHIIQDLERLVDDCIIMDYGRILLQKPTEEIMNLTRSYSCEITNGDEVLRHKEIFHPTYKDGNLEFHSMLQEHDVKVILDGSGVSYNSLQSKGVASLEDAFIGLTGKY